MTTFRDIDLSFLTREDIKGIEEQVTADLEFYVRCDPAAKSSDMVKTSYRTFKAVAAYRIAHRIEEKACETDNDLYHIYARSISEWAKSFSGVEIHPAAKIGVPFVIDHGWGVVIGETAEIGKHCCLLNGVVLGAMGIANNPVTKRHPTLGDNVQIGADTEILGNIRIGHNTVIGPRMKVTASIPDNARLIRITEYAILRLGDPNVFTL